LVYHAPLRMSSIYSPAPHSPTFFSFNPPAPPHTYTLSLHDALPISPARPQGRERNVVVSMWDWADPKVYLHDEIGTDKRNPTVNANGPVYGALEESADYMPVVDPARNTASQIKLQVRDPKTPSQANNPPAQPSPYW